MRNAIDLQVEICYNSAVEVVFIAQLKGCLKEIKGCGLRYKVGHVCWQLKYAWQRAWRGYDNTDVFNMASNLREKMIVMLEECNKNRHILFNKPNVDLLTPVEFDDIVMTDEETSAVIEKMIDLLRKSDEFYYYDNFIMKDGYTYEIVAKRCEESKNEFLDMMKLYGDQLWD